MERNMEVEFSENRTQAAEAAKRYEKIIPSANRVGYERINLIMTLTAADGVNGNAPLDWDRLLGADDFNFMHDISGINRHLDCSTGRIGGHFLPRFTKKQIAA